MNRLAWLWMVAVDVDPALPYAALPVAIWLATWAARRWWPGLWQWVARLGPVGTAASKAWQAVPSALLGAALAATAGLNPQDVALAGMVSLAAPLWHELLKAATAAVPWLPNYLGGAFPAAGGAAQPSGGAGTTPAASAEPPKASS